jgi:hypothetical protein
MGELSFLPPGTIRVARTSADPNETWLSLTDAVVDVADDVAATHLDLPAAAFDRWLWWFATPAAGVWAWDAQAVAALSARAAETDGVDTVLAMSREAQAVWPDGAPSPADCGVVRELTPAQLRDVARMVRLRGGANFSVPGAGKTTMALVTWAVLRQLAGIRRSIVVAPLSAHEAWANEPVDVFDNAARPDVRVRPAHLGGDIAVVNYEWLEAPGRLDDLRRWATTAPTLVVFDEAHRAKAGPRGVRGTAARELSVSATNRLVLTGTPQPNDPSDLVNILELAYPGRGAAIAGTPGRLHAAYTRVTKSELGLPPLTPRTEGLPMSAAHDRVYDAMVDAAARAAITDPPLVADVTRAGRIAMLLLQAATDPTGVLPVSGQLRMTGDRDDLGIEDLIRQLPESFVPTKFVRAVQLVGEHARTGRKVVLWACFRSHVERLRLLLAPHAPAIITGGVPAVNPAAPTDRQRELLRFRNDPDCNVLIATPHTLAEGVSLHHTTTHQVHLDRTYNAGMFLQSLDRTHRLGLPPDADCTATYLVGQRSDRSETVDGLVAARLDAKVTAMSAALDDPDLTRLALPDLHDQMTESDLLLGEGAAKDLAALFAHLITERNTR